MINPEPKFKEVAMAIEKATPKTRQEVPATVRFSEMLDRFFDDTVRMTPWGRDGFMPEVDVSETDTHFHYELSLPGMKKKEISINVDDNMLTISGERKFEEEKKQKGRYHIMENHYGSFSRSFTLPRNAKTDSIDATYENGMLKISVEKEKKSAGKEIEVK